MLATLVGWASAPPDDGVCEYLTRAAQEALRTNLARIAQRLPRPDVWGSDDAGGLYIEQHDGARAIWCRISADGAIRISTFEGAKRIGNAEVI